MQNGPGSSEAKKGVVGSAPGDGRAARMLLGAVEDRVCRHRPVDRWLVRSHPAPHQFASPMVVKPLAGSDPPQPRSSLSYLLNV